ncbi:hypothetical protein V5O48_010208 [Marasmius crinis-equi]|uniref:Uncharacterized protein n=1 Tax=Marasmius crinis-equi TaxID=585013 RepID=A0ABR3F8X9_9AGAR
MVQLSQASTVGNSDTPATSGTLSFPPPSTTLVEPGRRSTNPIDCSTGLSVIGFRTMEEGSHAVPCTYSSTTYNTERHTTFTQVTVEHVCVPGLVIATTTKVQFQHPDHFLNAAVNPDVASALVNSPVASDSPNVAVVQGSGYPTNNESEGGNSFEAGSGYNTNSTDMSFVDAYLIPSPPAYRRPVNQTPPPPPFYMVFAGREVGIFQGKWYVVRGGAYVSTR